jgi:hypothetical protein
MSGMIDSYQSNQQLLDIGDLILASFSQKIILYVDKIKNLESGIVEVDLKEYSLFEIIQNSSYLSKKIQFFVSDNNEEIYLYFFSRSNFQFVFLSKKNLSSEKELEKLEKAPLKKFISSS